MKNSKHSIAKFARGLTGISTPVFGVSWNPPKDRQEIVRRFVVFLEDRRALYQPYELENGTWVTRSILEIRREITKTIQESPDEPELIGPLRAMGAACRKYLDETNPQAHRIHLPHGSDLMFASALGELRGVFGLHLARLCVAYGVDVEPELASILPVADDESGEKL